MLSVFAFPSIPLTVRVLCYQQAPTEAGGTVDLLHVQRHVWILRYSADINVPRMEASAFAEYGLIPIDECYTATSGNMHHTLVYLKKRSRASSLQKFMTHYAEQHGLDEAWEHDVFGFTGSGERSGLFGHPSFAVLVQEHRRCGGDSGASYYSWLEHPGIHYGGIMAGFMKKKGGGASAGVISFDW